ncbi:MAG: hypothetical protein P8M55_07070 [Gammaproteobacteria bacterium]|jgi:hypothetical protein|nr:hypothetical protein [Gammaproteobacteria bacterium]MDG2435378.1 hypothetical protein [Gammaproteobacteria bacterium]
MSQIKKFFSLLLFYFTVIHTNSANELFVCTSMNQDNNTTDNWLLNNDNNTIEKSNAYSDDTLGGFKITKSDNKSLIWEKVTSKNRNTYVLDKNTMRQSITLLSISEDGKMTLDKRFFATCQSIKSSSVK